MKKFLLSLLLLIPLSYGQVIQEPVDFQFVPSASFRALHPNDGVVLLKLGQLEDVDASGSIGQCLKKATATSFNLGACGTGGGGGTDTLAALSCVTGQLPKWSGIAWVCGNDIDTNTDILGGLSCSTGQIAKWSGTAWACGVDEAGSGGGGTCTVEVDSTLTITNDVLSVTTPFTSAEKTKLGTLAANRQCPVLSSGSDGQVCGLSGGALAYIDQTGGGGGGLSSVYGNTTDQITVPAANDTLRAATENDVGKLAIDGLNIKIGTKLIDPGHRPVVTTRNFLSTDAPGGLNYRGTVTSYSSVSSPQVNDLVYDTTHHGWYRYSTSSNAWRTTNLITNFKGAFDDLEAAEDAVEVVGDKFWYPGVQVQFVTAFTAAVADRVHYSWLPPPEILELKTGKADVDLGNVSSTLTTAQKDNFKTKLSITAGGGGGTPGVTTIPGGPTLPDVADSEENEVFLLRTEGSAALWQYFGAETYNAVPTRNVAKDIDANIVLCTDSNSSPQRNYSTVLITADNSYVYVVHRTSSASSTCVRTTSDFSTVSYYYFRRFSVTTGAEDIDWQRRASLNTDRRVNRIAAVGGHLYFTIFGIGASAVHIDNDHIFIKQAGTGLASVLDLNPNEVGTATRYIIQISGDGSQLYGNYIYNTQRIFVKYTVNSDGSINNTAEGQTAIDGTASQLGVFSFLDEAHLWLRASNATSYAAYDVADDTPVNVDRNIDLGSFLGTDELLVLYAGFTQGILYYLTYKNLATPITGGKGIFAVNVKTGGWQPVHENLVFPESSNAFTGDGPPSASLGSEGHFYWDRILKILYLKEQGVWEQASSPKDQGIPKVSRLPAVTSTSPFLVNLTHDYEVGARDDTTVTPAFSASFNGYSDGRLFQSTGTITKTSPLTYILLNGTASSFTIDSIASPNEHFIDDFDSAAINGSDFNLGVKFIENGVFVKRITNSPTVTAASFTFNLKRSDNTFYFTTAETSTEIAGLYEKTDDGYEKLIFRGLNHVDGVSAPTTPPTAAAQSYIDDLGRMWVSGDTLVSTTVEPTITSSLWENDFYHYNAALPSDLTDGQFTIAYNTHSLFQRQGEDFVAPTWENAWAYITTHVTNTAETRNIRDNTVMLGAYSTFEDAAQARDEHTDAGKTYFFIKRNSPPPHRIRQIDTFEEGTVVTTDHFFWRGYFLISEDVLSLIKVSVADGGQRVNEDLTIGQSGNFLGICNLPGQTEYGSVTNTEWVSQGYTKLALGTGGVTLDLCLSTARFNYPKIISLNEVDLIVPSGITEVPDGTSTCITLDNAVDSDLPSNFINHFNISVNDVVAFNIQRSNGEFLFQTTPTARKLTFGDEIYNLPDPTDTVDTLPEAPHEIDKIIYARSDHRSDHIRQDATLTIANLGDGWFGWATGDGHFFSTAGGTVSPEPYNENVYEFAYKNTSGSQFQVRISSKKNKSDIGAILNLYFPGLTYGFAGSSTSVHTATKYYTYTLTGQIPASYRTVGNVGTLNMRFNDNTWGFAGIDAEKGFYDAKALNQLELIDLVSLFTVVVTQAQYDALTPTNNKLYFVPPSKIYRGNLLLLTTETPSPLNYLWDGPDNGKDTTYSSSSPHTSGTGILAYIENINTATYLGHPGDNPAPTSWQMNQSFSDTTTHPWFMYEINTSTAFNNVPSFKFASTDGTEYLAENEDFHTALRSTIAIVTRSIAGEVRHFMLSEATRTASGDYNFPADTSKYFTGTNVDVAIIDTSNSNITLSSNQQEMVLPPSDPNTIPSQLTFNEAYIHLIGLSNVLHVVQFISSTDIDQAYNKPGSVGTFVASYSATTWPDLEVTRLRLNTSGTNNIRTRFNRTGSVTFSNTISGDFSGLSFYVINYTDRQVKEYDQDSRTGIGGGIYCMGYERRS